MPLHTCVFPFALAPLGRPLSGLLKHTAHKASYTAAATDTIEKAISTMMETTDSGCQTAPPACVAAAPPAAVFVVLAVLASVVELLPAVLLLAPPLAPLGAGVRLDDVVGRAGKAPFPVLLLLPALAPPVPPALPVEAASFAGGEPDAGSVVPPEGPAVAPVPESDAPAASLKALRHVASIVPVSQVPPRAQAFKKEPSGSASEAAQVATKPAQHIARSLLYTMPSSVSADGNMMFFLNSVIQASVLLPLTGYVIRQPVSVP